MSLIARHLPDFEARYAIDFSLRDSVRSINDLDWHEVDGGIEAEYGPRVIRVDSDNITIRNTQFKSAIRIPLK